MTLALLIPLATGAAAAAVIGIARRWLAPDIAARLLTLVAVSAALSAGWALTLAAFAWAVSYRAVDSVATWCAVATPGHHPVGTAVGVAATALLAVGTIRVVRAALGFWRTDAEWRGSDDVEIVASDEPVAFAVPGRHGTVVVSTGLLRRLSRGQRDALLAHEHAHVRFGHHRYVRAARLASVAIPILRPVEQWVRLATERWADEEAARVVGNRHVVADALVAAVDAQATGQLPFGGAAHLEARIDALRNPRSTHHVVVRVALSAVGLAAVASLGSSLWQLQNLAGFMHHVCTGA
jgi:Zn-dependent protease with chaperone function